MKRQTPDAWYFVSIFWAAFWTFATLIAAVTCYTFSLHVATGFCLVGVPAVLALINLIPLVLESRDRRAPVRQRHAKARIPGPRALPR
jgi:hypothetical protein